MKIKKLLTAISKIKGFENDDIHNASDSKFIEYYLITGFLNEKYFHFNIMKIIDERKIQIVDTTDCEKELKAELLAIDKNLIFV